MYGGDSVEEHWLENDAVGSACKVRNLGELVEKPGRHKPREGGEKQRVGGCVEEEEWGAMCYDRTKQNV